jgi:hypothetical protein
MSRLLQKVALLSSALFTIEVCSELSPTLAGVHPARLSVSLSILCTCCTIEAASGFALHSDFSIFEIPVLGRPQTWRTLKFTVCFEVSHGPGHTRRQATNFTDITFAKRELAVNTLRKVKSVKTFCPTYISFKSLNPTKTSCSWLTLWLWLCVTQSATLCPVRSGSSCFLSPTANHGCQFSRYGLWAEPTENTASNISHFVACMSVATITWRLLNYCLATGVFAETFPSNGCLCWLHNSGFHQTCEKIYFLHFLTICRISDL